MISRFILIYIISVLVQCHFSIVLAQNIQERPKIGVVLSGGGVKGLAHIGVLKSMEEAGIYPDYITGTSMGSIVGGLYAVGYSADQIDSIARGINWSTLLSNEIALNKVAFEEKFYYGRYIIDFPFRNKKLGLPMGLIEGQELTLQLSNMTRPAHQISDFDELPIPFACMGANIVTGYPKVLDSGLLPEALRASMAIPTFFTPVEIDSNLYVDGGLLKNFPVQEVIDMGADIVIGVTVSTGLDPREKLNSMTSILGQAAFITSALDTEEQLKLVDILVIPDLTGFSTGSFSESDAILEVGFETGKKYFNQFKQLADSLSQYGPMKPPARPHVPKEYRFEHIKIVGNQTVPSELIMGKLRVEPNKPFTIEELEDRIALLYGTLYFTKIVYSINPLTSTLTIKVVESPRGSLRTAVHYDSDNKVGLNLNLTLRNIVFPSSRFIVEFDFAQNPNAYLSYFKYLGKKQNLAVVLKGNWIRSNLPSYWAENSTENAPNNDGINGLLSNRLFNAAMSIQATVKTNSTVGASFQYINYNIQPVVLDSISLSNVNVAFEQMATKDLGATVFYKINSANKQFFPTQGIILNLSLDYFFNRNFQVEFSSNSLGDLSSESVSKNHYVAYAEINVAQPLAEKLTLLSRATIRIGSGDGGIEWFPYETQFGGSRPLGWPVYSYSATPTNRFSNLNYTALGIGLQWEAINNFYVSAFTDYLESEYPIKWLSSDIHTHDFDAHPRRLGFNLKLSYNTIVGPLELGIGKDQYLSGAHLFFGFGYYIKN